MKFKIIICTLLISTFFNFVMATNEPIINSKYAVVLDADSSIVLYNKNMNEKLYPASTTKILTAILAIENLDLDKSVTVSKTSIDIPFDSSSVYLKEGEIMKVNDLLYCLLLNSGNDAANVLAEAVSGDIDTFIQLMNDTVKKIGCTSTHFNNAHGYSDSNHYTSALDMAKIFNYCIQNEQFVNILSTKSYIVSPTNKTSSKRYLQNTNRLILTPEESIYSRYYEYCIGGKTGFTNESGRTLVTFSKKGNKTVIVALFGASTSGTQDIRYTDAINLFEYSFNNYEKKTIAKSSDYNFNYINTDKQLNYSIGLKEDVSILSNNDSNIDLSYIINIYHDKLSELTENNFKEVPAGQIIYTFYDNDQNVYEASQTLYLKSIQKYSTFTHKKILTPTLLFIFIIVMIFIIVIINKNNNHLSSEKNNIRSRKTRRNIKNKNTVS